MELKLTHLDWNPEANLIHFQGQYCNTCELDYHILQGEIQNIPKTQTPLDVGDFCLVEDLSSDRWYRGRVQSRKEDFYDVFLIDHGNILSVDVVHIFSCSDDLFILPQKVVCGFLANVLLLPASSSSNVEKYLSSHIGSDVTGQILALLPHGVLLLESPDINCDLVLHGFGKHVDTDTFLLLVEMMTDVPLKQNTDVFFKSVTEKHQLKGYEEISSFCGPRLSRGTRANVRVTAAVSPGLFFCQMVGMETDLWEMSKKLAKVSTHKSKDSHQTAENLGPLCSVKGKDGRWSRGFLQFLPVNARVRVLFIDYGFFDYVGVDDIHRLPPDLYSTPIMAFPCSLDSLNDHGDAVKAQQLSFLKAGLLGTVLDVEINSFSEEQHVYSIKVVKAQENHKMEPDPVQQSPRMKVQNDIKTEPSSPLSGILYSKTVMGQTLVKTLEEEKVQVDSVFVGYVECTQNPNDFWIRTQKRNQDFEEMMSKITEHFSRVKLEEDVLWNPERGTLCCALYEEDRHFYRGVVVGNLENGAEVLFIDFGNIEKVPHMLIKKIPPAFAKQPAFAICCTLVNVIPVQDWWSSWSIDIFRRAVSNKSLLVHVVQMRKYKLVVDLHETGGNNGPSVSEILVSSKQAELWKTIPAEAVGLNKQNKQEITRSSRNISEATDWKDGDHRKTADTDEFEPTTIPKCFKAVVIKPGCEFAVCCSYISSPSYFWCQQRDKVPALEELMSKIQQFYTTHTAPLQDGDIRCIAKSPQDGRWYRAVITDRQAGCATVLSVDYGFTFQIQERSLQQMMPEYVNLERQAFRCSLSNLIEPAETERDWNAGTNYLKTFSRDSTGCLRCKVVSQLKEKNKELYHVVELYNTQTQQTVTSALVEQGLAKEVPVSMKQMSAAFPMSFVHSSFNLQLNCEEHVFVTHVSSQWEVYVQLERNFEDIDQLEKKISEESEQLKERRHKDVVRRLCLAKYLDGNWHRGLVRPIQLPRHLYVFFVDYGNTHICEKTQVMFIPKDSSHLLYTPMQALKLNLATVPRKELDADAHKWLEGAILYKSVRAVIVGKKEDGSYDVELFDEGGNLNQKVKKFLVSHVPQPKTVTQYNTAKDSTRTMKTHMIAKSHRNNQPYVMSNARLKMPVSKKKFRNEGDVESCADVRLNIKSVKVKDEWRPETPEIKSTKDRVHLKPQTKPDEPQTPQVSCLPSTPVNAGCKVNCFVSHMNSCRSFFLQRAEDEPAILEMADQLNSSVFRDSLRRTTQALKVNDLVLAQYEDSALYRAVVKDHGDGSCYKVEFLDYGNSAVVQAENIYSLPKEFCSQPVFSMSCCLLDTSMFDSDSSFADAVMEKPLIVHFVRQCGAHWEIEFDTLPAVQSSTETVENEEMVSKDELQEVPVSSSEVAEKETDCQQMLFIGNAITHVIAANDAENVVLLSVLSNGEFYTRLVKTNHLLVALEACIDGNIDKCEMAAETDIQHGLKCLVEVQGKWKRAVVQCVGQDKHQVLLVDDGVIEDISSSSVKQQCKEVTNIPNLAVLCKMNCSSTEGCDHTRRPLNSMIGEEVKLVFLHYSEIHHVWMVEISNNGLFTFPTSTLEEDAITPSPATTPNQSTEGECLSELSPHQRLVFAPVSVGKAYDGCAAAMATPFEFCICLDEMFLIISEVSTMLDNLSGELSSLPEAKLVPGKCCLFKSKFTDKWCRTEITHAGTTVVLNLVDYGHCEYLPVADGFKLKQLPEDLLKFPKVTYPCTLRGVHPVSQDGHWTNESALFFQQCLYQKSLEIFFTEFVTSSHWVVDILVDGVHVAKKLVDAGHASYIDHILGLRYAVRLSDI